MYATLRVIPRKEPSFDFEMKSEHILIGRALKAELSFMDQSVSRDHARIFWHNQQLLLQDLNSHNGTRLNGLLVRTPTVLQVGDVVEIGETRISVREFSYAPHDGVARAKPTDPVHGEPHTVLKKPAELLGDPTCETPVLTTALKEEKRFIKRLKLLNETHAALNRSVKHDELLEHILDWVFHNLSPQEATIFLKQEGDLSAAASRTLSGREPGFVFSEHLRREVVEGGNAALVYDAVIDERFTEALSIVGTGVRSLVAAPLLDKDGCFGMIVVNSQATIRQFSEEDLELLVALASVATLRIRNLSLVEEMAERGRIQKELAQAREIQVRILPQQLPQIEGYQIFGENTPSRFVSGDYYEVVQRRDGAECVFLVADVSGKGLAASLLTVSLEALAAGPIEDGRTPAEMCGQLTRLLYRRTTADKYATMFLATLEPASGKLCYVNAGHNPALLLTSSGETKWLESQNVPIGLLNPERFGSYESGEIQLLPGDLLLMYTDGITEANDPDEEEYGETRLEAICRQHRENELPSLANAIHQDLALFARGVPYTDDQTLVIIRRHLQ